MDLYHATFACSLLLNSLVLYTSQRSHKAPPPPPAPLQSGSSLKTAEPQDRVESNHCEALGKLKRRFFPIYLLVNGADWLQGPYIYPIYKDEKGLPEQTVAFLFMIGFVSAGLSASFAGTFADRHGRKTACLAFCAIYSLSCATLFTNNLSVLFLGRVLGGISGTLLWSVFESWLVAEFNQLMLPDADPILSGIFSTMTTANTCVAIAAGILAEWLVHRAGTAEAPFLASIVCLAVAFVAISRFWGENYGSSKHDTAESATLLREEEADSSSPATSPLRMIFHDRNIRILALASCFFEGSLFLFIFFKFPALTLSHKLSGATEELPFGLIFAILMCSMMFGSMLYKRISTSATPMPAPTILTNLLAVAAACFFVPAYFRDERITLWCFCIFEVCCGVYYPVMGSLKGRLIDDGARASLYGILRVPLNAFVVVALSTTKEGESHRDMVFTTCGLLLSFAAAVVHTTLT